MLFKSTHTFHKITCAFSRLIFGLFAWSIGNIILLCIMFCHIRDTHMGEAADVSAGCQPGGWMGQKMCQLICERPLISVKIKLSIHCINIFAAWYI